MGHMPGAPVWLVLGGTNYWAEAGGRAREAGRGQRATVWNPELGPLFCHRADGGLEGWRLFGQDKPGGGRGAGSPRPFPCQTRPLSSSKSSLSPMGIYQRTAPAGSLEGGNRHSFDTRYAPKAALLAFVIYFTEQWECGFIVLNTATARIQGIAFVELEPGAAFGAPLSIPWGVLGSGGGGGGGRRTLLSRSQRNGTGMHIIQAAAHACMRGTPNMGLMISPSAKAFRGSYCPPKRHQP